MGVIFSEASSSRLSEMDSPFGNAPSAKSRVNSPLGEEGSALKNPDPFSKKLQLPLLLLFFSKNNKGKTPMSLSAASGSDG